MPRFAPRAEALEARDVPDAAFDTLPVLPAADPAILDAARATLARGGALGRRTDVFLKVGDSNSDVGYGAGYLFPFGGAGYDATGLAATHPELLDTLAAYRTPAGSTGSNSFGRASPVAVAGGRVTTVFDGVAGEAAATGAGVALVMIGTNDVYLGRGPDVFRTELRELVRRLTAAGVVPVLSTIPDNLAFNGTRTVAVAGYNQVIADVADEAHVPLWNMWRAFSALPNRGLGSDGLHISASPNPGGVTGGDLAFGQNLRSLQALQVLDWFREQVVAAAPEAVAPKRWAPLEEGEAVYAVGRAEGQAPAVSVFAADGTERNRILAFDPGFTGGVRVATADVTDDGVPDVIAGAGVGGAPVVRVFSGADGALVASFYAFESGFRTGVNVAAADLNGDGVAEIVAGAGDGGGPVVAVFRGGDFTEIDRFFAYEPSFRGGVNVAAGTVAGIGPAIVTGAGVGGGPLVKVFRLGAAEPALAYFAYGPDDRTGVVAAVSDGLLATAPAGAAPHVRIVDPRTGAERASFFAPLPGTTGVRLGVLRQPGEPDVLLMGNAPGSATAVAAYRAGELGAFTPTDATRAYGVYLG